MAKSFWCKLANSFTRLETLQPAELCESLNSYFKFCVEVVRLFLRDNKQQGVHAIDSTASNFQATCCLTALSFREY